MQRQLERRTHISAGLAGRDVHAWAATAIAGLSLLAGCSPSRAPLAESAPAHEGSAEPGPTPVPDTPEMRQLHTYYTGGVHNEFQCQPESKCSYQRQAGEPSDPQYPEWWTSEWTMYRVFAGYEQHPPPYASPPAGLQPGRDYEVSYGATYYDSTYTPADGDGKGAMMEHYEKQCLPIFPSSNDYTCSFVSLGNKAYFLRYADRPEGTPACCQFSLDNHPPARDFIKHLPYDAAQSQHLDATIQAYSMQVPPGILFGYAFYKQESADAVDPSLSYRHPQSFFFSGSPTHPPDAPIVSQNYTSFRAQKPSPGDTWDQVAATCHGEIPWCCLFDSDCPSTRAVGAAAPDWADAKP